MIKELLLLITGGAITFAFTLIINRISKRKASIVWRTLPPIHLPKEGLAALQIIITNEGDAPATSVRTIVTLGNKERFESVDVHPSETALEHSCPSTDPLELQLPRFPSQASVSLSCIVRSSEEPTPRISIVGDGDIIGAEAEPPSRERVVRIRKRVIKMYGITYAVMMIILLLMAIWAVTISVEYRDGLQQIAIGDLYFKIGEYESARQSYSAITSKWYKPPKPIVLVRLAAVAAAQGRNEAAIELLKQLQDDGSDAVQMLLLDPVFDSVRNQPNFKKLLTTNKD